MYGMLMSEESEDLVKSTSATASTICVTPCSLCFLFLQPHKASTFLFHKWIGFDGSLLVGLLWRLDLWASMRSFNGDFPPWRCTRRQRRRGERRHHPLGNKPWKKELHHQDEPWIRSLEGCFNGGKETGRERERGEHEIEGRKRERSWTLSCVSQDSHSSKLQQVLLMLLFID